MIRIPMLPFLLATGVLCSGLAQPAGAQDYPRKPVRLIVGFPPGGGGSIGAQLIAPKLGQFLGQQVIVEHKPGAGSAIAADLVAKAAPDGYTLLAGSSSMTIFPASKAKFPFDSRTDFAPVGNLFSSGFMMVADPALPASNVGELIAHAKANPGKLNYGAINSGADYLLFEYFKLLAGIDIVHVPYKGFGDIDQALLSKQIDVSLTSGGALQYVKAGRMKVLGVTGLTRVPSLPNVPAIAETIPGFEGSFFVGILAPAGTPRDIINKINQGINAGLSDADTRDKYLALNFITAPGTPADFEKLYHGYINRWLDLVKRSKLNLE